MNLLKREDCMPSICMVAAKYESVIENNLLKRQNGLMDQLFEQAMALKEELALFRKEASQENIDKRIAERRREKEKQREVLESRWRECTESFKQMQDEQKRLINESKQNLFDIHNLQNKIEQFQQHVQQAKARLSKIQEAKQQQFMTEIKENYQSPYKNERSVQHRKLQNHQKELRLMAQYQQHFFSTKYQLNPPKISREHSRKIDSQQSECRAFRVLPKHPNTLSLNGVAFDGQVDCIVSDKKQSRLSAFLNQKQVRVKLFKLLRKPL